MGKTARLAAVAALSAVLAPLPSCDNGERLARCRAEGLIRAAEGFRAANGYYPADAAEMGMVGAPGDGSYYQAAPGGYIVCCGTFLGDSAVYDGVGKKWER